MAASLLKNWKIYVIEAWALGMFMVSAGMFSILVFHPSLPIYAAIKSDFLKRLLMGSIMGATAILLIYSGWGKRSGAHMNPATTLAQYQLNRIEATDALFYIVAQFVGGSLGVALVYAFLPDYFASPSVNFAVTMPNKGIWTAFLCEFMMAFALLTMVLTVSNNARLAPYTGYLVGLTVALFITFEAPISGMSINPARTFSSAIWANAWTGIWIYFVAPVAGMQCAAWLYRKQYRRKHGECGSMKMHLSGQKHNCQTYQVLWWSKEN